MTKKNTSWGNVADWYDDTIKDDNSFQTHVIAPNMQRLLNITKGQSVLDVACGSGFFSKYCSEAGATVTGIDIAPELIAIATGLRLPHATFSVGNVETLPTVADKSIDTAFCILALQNIRNVSSVFKEVNRTLKPGGRFLVVLNHPTFRIPKQSSWGWDEATKTEYRRIDGYLTESQTEIDMTPGSQTKKELTVSFHRSLQYYFKVATNAGFTVSRLEEWISHREPPAGKTFAARNKARKEFPLFLFLEFKK